MWYRLWIRNRKKVVSETHAISYDKERQGKCISVFGVNNTRRVWRYQMGNHNPYVEGEQTTQLPKEKVQRDKRYTKHTHYTKDRVTRNHPLSLSLSLSVSLSLSHDSRREIVNYEMVHSWFPFTSTFDSFQSYWYSFFALRPMIPVSLDCPFLIASSAFSYSYSYRTDFRMFIVKKNLLREKAT